RAPRWRSCPRATRRSCRWRPPRRWPRGSPRWPPAWAAWWGSYRPPSWWIRRTRSSWRRGSPPASATRRPGSARWPPPASALRPDAVAALGDLQYPDATLGDFRRFFGPSWGRWRARMHPSPGNHEYNTGGASGYYDYFGARAGPGRRGWYSWNLGAWHLISL